MTRALQAVPGFDRLIEILKQHGISVDMRPASPRALKAGDSVFGEPFDPVLASFYARCDGGLFGDIEIFEFAPNVGSDLLSLANAEGVQPVVLILYYMDLLIYPLASSVDKAFELWARYADARLRRYGRLDEFMIAVDIPFIWGEAQLIAQDTELVRMLDAGKFDELMGDEPERLKWKQSILQAARSSPR